MTVAKLCTISLTGFISLKGASVGAELAVEAARPAGYG